jgi:hypothetical protein
MQVSSALNASRVLESFINFFPFFFGRFKEATTLHSSNRSIFIKTGLNLLPNCCSQGNIKKRRHKERKKEFVDKGIEIYLI